MIAFFFEKKAAIQLFSFSEEGEVYPGTERIVRSEDKIEGGETIDDFQIKVPQALGTPADVLPSQMIRGTRASVTDPQMAVLSKFCQENRVLENGWHNAKQPR